MSTTLLDGPATAVTVRPGSAADHDALWRIFHPVLLSQETYALTADTTRAEAVAYWTANQGPWFVA
jgi:hypothetical protein